MIAEIVSIGTELLLGQIANRDAQLLSQWLADLGFDVFWHVTVGDNLARAEEALRRAAERADVVITSGGLGPTYDDITREAVARAAGRPLVENEEALSQVEAWFRSRGIPFLDVNRRQALMPEGAVCLANPRGSAPGFWLPGQPIFVALPGPPRELEAMFRREVAPRLRALSAETIVSRVLKVVGLGESALEGMLADLYAQRAPTVAPYAKLQEVHLRVTAKAGTEEEAESILAPVVAELRARLGHHIYGEGEETLSGAILGRLRRLGATLATAESATGGLLSARLTDVPGASDVFVGGVVVYQNRAKETLLHVPASLLEGPGPVSREMALFLAEEVRGALGADFGVATVGYAGPTGADVGRTFHAIVGPGAEKVEERRFPGDRDDVRQRLTQATLTTLWLTLAESGT